MLELLNKMNDQSRMLAFLAIANPDRTQISGCISLKEIMRFLVNSYKGDLSVFRLPSSNITAVGKQSLVRANDSDSLLHVLRVMAASRISLLPIERKIEDPTCNKKTTFTVGLMYLNDLLYLLGMPNFWESLNEPVLEFFKELYGPMEIADSISE